MGNKLMILIVCLLFLFVLLSAQELPESEFQASFNAYIDNFEVMIFYPTISMTRQVNESTSVTGRYLVDAITAASMKSRFEVDGITSATQMTEGGGDDTPDELRHEMGVGVTRIVSKGTVSLNALYSTEHDYTSATIAGSYSHPFAKKNTVVQVGLVKSWDKVAPQTREWEKDKDAIAFNANLTQALHKRAIAQMDLSYIRETGFLSDAYKVVRIVQDYHTLSFEPVHPDELDRKAVGLRTNVKLTKTSSIQLGYRYYWDTWEVDSQTYSVLAQKHFLEQRLAFGLGFRYYAQDRAFFFEPEYAEPAKYMTVDSKLDSGYSRELQFKAGVNGGLLRYVPVLHNESVDLNARLILYHRHTNTIDWHSRRKELNAIILNLGIRYRF